MRKQLFLLAAAAFALTIAPALAADLAPKPVYKAPPAPVAPVYTWTGLYVGANAGYSWGPWDASSNQQLFATEVFTDRAKVNGALGGLQAGYNQQYGQWLLGLEADIQITGERDKHTWTDPGSNCLLDDVLIPPTCGGGPASVSHEWKFPWFGTLRARGGLLATPNWLLYATGGLAYGESDYDFSFSQPGAGRAQTISSHVTKAGWTAGGGVETLFASNWSAKLEYLYLDLGTHAVDTRDVDGAPLHIEHRVRDHILRLGLNYHFNAAPVVARY
jgi:outer membrane immunogenic protein